MVLANGGTGSHPGGDRRGSRQRRERKREDKKAARCEWNLRARVDCMRRSGARPKTLAVRAALEEAKDFVAIGGA